ncbi:NAD(P)-binding protein [Calocera viscosa TUFC12733]|uniref:NAD(P)-binding protein n=1 Tax=Calocera viscosa (strain TUFC12733) TaxID=1330018 RepID=A0A167J222_CALVF|nr:NAD(P)-binding protein [Calocera viscosa TUFC12733]
MTGADARVDNIYYYKCDVSNAEEVETAATRVRKEVGDPTVIVNSAAIVAPGPLLSQSASSVARAFEVNTLSHFNILRTFLPYLVAQKSGHVVTISSILGQQGVAHLSAYCATKAALVSLHRSLRRELISHCRVPGVRTTLLVPGQIHTSLFASLQLRKNWLRDFVAPPLPAHTVVKEIIRSLDERESGEVYMPFYARCVEALDWLPLWVRDAVQAWTGADEGMAAAGGQTGSEQEKNVA